VLCREKPFVLPDSFLRWIALPMPRNEPPASFTKQVIRSIFSHLRNLSQEEKAISWDKSDWWPAIT
jgi:hypothetical protein